MSNDRVVSLRDMVNFLEGNVGVRAYRMWSAGVLPTRAVFEEFGAQVLGFRVWGSGFAVL